MCTFSSACETDMIDSRQHTAYRPQFVAANLQHVRCTADLHPRLGGTLAILRPLQRRHERVCIAKIFQVQFFPAP